MNKIIPLTIRLDKKTKKKLDVAAKKLGMSKATVIRLSIKYLYENL